MGVNSEEKRACCDRKFCEAFASMHLGLKKKKNGLKILMANWIW